MSRTIVINLLFGWLTLIMSFVLAKYMDGFQMIRWWIGVQVACWAGALTLLRWRKEVFAPAFLAFCHNLCCFIAAALMSYGHETQADVTAVLALLEFGVVAFVVLVLSYHSTLLNVAEVPTQQLPEPRLQFDLISLLALVMLIAIGCTLIFASFRSAGDWGLGLLMLGQGFVWLLTADQLLQTRVRWWLVVAITVAMLVAWVAYIVFQKIDLEFWRYHWGRSQMMVLLTVLAYRWAGWRIVPYEVAAQLLADANPMERFPKLGT